MGKEGKGGEGRWKRNERWERGKEKKEAIYKIFTSGNLKLDAESQIGQ